MEGAHVVEADPAARLRSRPGLPREIHVLAAAAFVIAIGYGLVAPALPAFARSFDVGFTAASAVVSAFALFRLGFAPVSGRLVGRLGELRTYVLGLGIVAASTGACAFAGAYVKDAGQFLLPYRTVRTAPDPDALLLDFLQATYEAAADNAHWDRAALEDDPARRAAPR